MTQLPHTKVRAACEHEGEAEGIGFCSPLASHPALLAGTTQLLHTKVTAACEHKEEAEGINFCSPLETHPASLAGMT